METKLDVICHSIPCSDSGDVSTQATAIMKSLTGQDVEFDIRTGGTQPTLFQVPISEGYNVVTWASSNPANGSFGATTIATINNVPVSSPLTVTQQLDGEELVITTSCTNFNSTTTTVTLHYAELPTGKLSILDASNLSIIRKTTSSSGGNNPVYWFLALNPGAAGQLFDYSVDGGITWRSFYNDPYVFIIIKLGTRTSNGTFTPSGIDLTSPINIPLMIKFKSQTRWQSSFMSIKGNAMYFPWYSSVGGYVLSLYSNETYPIPGTLRYTDNNDLIQIYSGTTSLMGNNFFSSLIFPYDSSNNYLNYRTKLYTLINDTNSVEATSNFEREGYDGDILTFTFKFFYHL